VTSPGSGLERRKSDDAVHTCVANNQLIKPQSFPVDGDGEKPAQIDNMVRGYAARLWPDISGGR